MNEARNELMNESFHYLLENSHLFLEAKHRPPPTLLCPRRKDKVLVPFAAFLGGSVPHYRPCTDLILVELTVNHFTPYLAEEKHSLHFCLLFKETFQVITCGVNNRWMMIKQH